MADEPEQTGSRLPSAYTSLLIAGTIATLGGIALIVLNGDGRLSSIGSIVGSAGAATLLAAVMAKLAANHQAEDLARREQALRNERAVARHERESDMSIALAARLHSAREHDDQHFGGTVLVHPVYLQGRSFQRAILDRARWSGARLDTCDFTEASLLGTDLAECTVDGAKFLKASLDGAHLQGTFTEAQFEGCSAGGTDFSRAWLDRSSFASGDEAVTYLKGATFAGSSALDSTDFSRTRCDDTDFSDAKIYGANFTNAFLADARFDRAELHGCTFRGAMLAAINGGQTASFDEAQLADSDFKEYLAADFSETWLIGIDFSSAVGVEHAKFDGAIVVASTKWPEGFDPAERGALVLHKMPKDDARAAWDDWVNRHGRAAGWL